MPAMRSLVIDISTAPLENADYYLEDVVRAPSTYKDPEKIAAYIAEKTAERLQMAATDVDLARLTGIGTCDDVLLQTDLCTDEDAERAALARLASLITPTTRIVTFGGFNFDLPLLQRRARYLDVRFPHISTDRFKSPHRDLCEELSDRNPQRRRSLQFYAKRLGMTDIHKTLSGAEEGRIFEHQRWDDLRVSLEHDVTATYRLARWMGVIAKEAVTA